MSTESSVLLVIASSGRAIAQSARSAGYRVYTLDGFCDQDTRACGPCVRLPLNGSKLAVFALKAETQARLDRRDAGEVAGVVLGAGLEGSPEVLSWLADRLPVYANSEETYRALGNPRRFLGLLTDLGIEHPASQLLPPGERAEGLWLLKEPMSSGGLGVHCWGPSVSAPPTAHYFQRHLPGVPGSLSFLANGREVSVLGFNRLLLSDASERRPFLYGGVLSGLTIGAGHARLVEDWARRLTQALGLRGLNGLDFLLTDEGPRLLEVNARPTAAMGLYERPEEGGLIARHIAACQGHLPAGSGQGPTGLRGEQTLYAWRDLQIRADWSWPHWTSDRPCAGTHVPRSAPLCTLAAEGDTQAEVEDSLRGRGRWLVRHLGGGRTRAGAIEERL